MAKSGDLRLSKSFDAKTRHKRAAKNQENHSKDEIVSFSSSFQLDRSLQPFQLVRPFLSNYKNIIKASMSMISTTNLGFKRRWLPTQ